MSSKPIEDGRIAPLPGVTANSRLTALTGALLIVLLGLMGITILSVRAMLPQHFLLGFVLLPPLALKVASSGYRFARYYAGDFGYRQAGPPRVLLRLIAPLLVAATAAVFITGLELWFFGLRFGSIWVGAHKFSFIIWLPLAGVHVLGHVGKTGAAVAAELSNSPAAPATTRRSLVIGSLVAGAVLAAVSLTYASPFIFFRDG